ncbi:2OG-Fe(II) oxygenase family protein [Shewanella marisflavi]|uniref:2OG-Fe(II) oxygenase n=1 Tax=Shewanella marisflavi TaxID=260364 RepID=A0AAC9TYE9_9GAMM|nr:2OG-Fe(II) oxygenase [Shewanella marisflavi]ASJ95927.1 2OG-Fe(II) oxygenase [Shewanella marisflavi]
MSVNQLLFARSLPLPSREAMLQRAESVQKFWNNNKQVLKDAWGEWEETESRLRVFPDDSVLDSQLLDAVTKAWKDPSKEIQVRELWKETSSGVYQAQFFDPERLILLRDYLDKAFDSKIPVRPPYGIVLNRKGAMLDPRSEGFLAAPKFQEFYRDIIDRFMRPIARMLFPEIVGFDSQSFGFSIQYQADMDTSLRLHTDASTVTLNVNLNLPGEEYSGSEVDFYDPATGKVNRLAFEPGVAMLHRGHVAHAAQPILRGERTNIVLWLYGTQGKLPAEVTVNHMVDAAQRWQVPNTPLDSFAPF